MDLQELSQSYTFDMAEPLAMLISKQTFGLV